MYTIEDIARICEGTCLQAGNRLNPVLYLCTDSRKVVFADSSLFIAIRGLYHDGHLFAEQAYSKGIRYFLINRDAAISLHADAVYVCVDDTLEAIQKLAAYHRRRFHYPVIGITGSNGKTVVKEWLYQLLSPSYQIIKSPGSYNSQIGVPLSLWNMASEHTLGIFEAGISKPGEMQKLARMIRPDIGIFTMIGDAHGENFSSVEQKIREKLQLFHSCHTLIYCRDHVAIHEVIRAYEPLRGIRFFTWSATQDAEMRVLSVSKFHGSTVLQLQAGEKFEITIPFTDHASIENALHGVATMLVLNVPVAEIQHTVAGLQPVAMRLEMKKGINGCRIINDAYNADLDSIRIALQYLFELGSHHKKTLILTDIQQSGKPEGQLYRELADLVNGYNFERVMLIGQAIAMHKNLFQRVSHIFSNTDELLQALPLLNFREEDVLIKGARVFQLERLDTFLVEKIHSTVLEINLNALAHNLNYYRSLLQPGTRLMAMVKAASYGTGEHEVAQLLEFYKADYLAVAYTDEGIHLRQQGVSLPVMVMSPETEHYDRMAQYRLEPEIYNQRSLTRFILFARSTTSDVPPVHLKINTGMNRLGFDLEEISVLIRLLKENPQIQVASVFSHLAASESAQHDAFTEIQISRFNQACQMLYDALGYMPLRHILNTGGIERFPEAQYEMVRLGIGLYGVGATPEQSKHLMPVARMKTVISQIRKVPARESVGYGRSTVCEKDTVIATVPVGYADGYRRSLSNGIGAMVVNGMLAPVVGRICMDMTMIDITGIDASEGDEVIIFGDSILPLEKLAQQMQTIPYEILTGISHRVKRIFVKE
ncbi:MAG: bifunctional UDP-N-acetylmuramoyl-tripeptide:D-alanyl-D-alanine ligase/alanine racemase [Flavobacteriales bacterium]|nr:bifunctional UDP-N-acetylmuramoyl-tripeptide:D-alanyl-D-alanine ligase/alanine racemase [Flavobacteriales bacterium]